MLLCVAVKQVAAWASCKNQPMSTKVNPPLQAEEAAVAWPKHYPTCSLAKTLRPPGMGLALIFCPRDLPAQGQYDNYWQHYQRQHQIQCQP